VTDERRIEERLERIEEKLDALLRQEPAKDRYTTAEVAEIVGRSEYSVREWCRKGQVRAVKAPNGRSWLIPQDELLRIRNEGPLPEQQADSVFQGRRPQV
jgi:excisionase family DNA binding protein